jgi:hypothetical protein
MQAYWNRHRTRPLARRYVKTVGLGRAGTPRPTNGRFTGQAAREGNRESSDRFDRLSTSL